MSKITKNNRQKVVFHAELRPNQSNTKSGVRLLSITLCAIFIFAGLIFISVGAWPVFGFFGLELFLLILLLNINHRFNHITERITLIAVDLKVEEIDPWGRIRRWSFQRYWLKVNLRENDVEGCTLELRSHGKSLVIGAFLSPNARRRIAIKINRALRQSDPISLVN